jgi:prepilin-type processing-associated H-X9-DG protein
MRRIYIGAPPKLCRTSGSRKGGVSVSARYIQLLILLVTLAAFLGRVHVGFFDGH